MTPETLHLSSVQVGTEVAVIFVNPSHNRDRRKYGSIQTISRWDDKFKRWLFVKNGAMPADGKGYFFMSKKINPDFYYSANPEHLRKAKAAHKKAKQKREKLKIERDAVLALAAPITHAIYGDKNDSEDYAPDVFTEGLAYKLTTEQLKTLRGWLNIK